jgi:recombination protein RecT
MAKQSHTQSKSAPVDNMKVIKDFIESGQNKADFEAILGKRAPGFIVEVLQIISQDSQLQVADLQSLVNASKRAAMLGLSLDPSLHLAFIFPWKDPKTSKIYAQFQIGWRGLVDLCHRTDKYKIINVTDVREGELKGKDGLTGDYTWDWNQDVKIRETLPVIGYVSYFELSNGFKKSLYWTGEMLIEHATKYSESYSRKEGHWVTDFPAMARKTVLKSSLHDWGPKSTELVIAIESDQGIITGAEQKIEYLDNPNSPADKEQAKRKGKAAAGIEALKGKLKK